MHHFGDPCIHCNIPHDDVPAGSCGGDPKKAKPIAYRSLGVRWDNVEHFRVLMSSGEVREFHQHVSYSGPYYHFGYSDTLTSPPRYDPTL